MKYLHPSFYFIATCLLLIFVACEKSEPDPSNIPIIENINHVLNPSGRCPLTAMTTIESSRESKVTIAVQGNSPLVKTFNAFSIVHELPILGLYADTNNEVIITLEDNQGITEKDTIYIQTEALPDYLPTMDIVKIEESSMETGWSFCNVGIGNGNSEFLSQPMMFDNLGNVRWYMDLGRNLNLPIIRNRNGNLVFADYNVLFELDMLGNELSRSSLGSYVQHHEIFEKEDGNLLIAVTDQNSGSSLDFIIEFDTQINSIIEVWDLREYLDVDRTNLVLFSGTDWMHVNSIGYDKVDNSLVISGRNQGICKVGYDKKLKWIMAPHRGWEKSGVNGNGFETADFLLQATDQNGAILDDQIQKGVSISDNFEWTWGQHAVLVLDNQDILVFDNGFNRNFQFQNEGYSRAVSYTIDENNMQIKQNWQYGKELGNPFWAKIISDVDVLPQSGNLLITAGVNSFGASIHEITYPDNNLLFKANIIFKNQNGGGSTWGDYDLMYRSERMSIYPE